MLRNGEHYALSVEPIGLNDIWLNYSLSWSNTTECDGVPSQVMPGSSWCVGVFNQSYQACESFLFLS